MADLERIRTDLGDEHAALDAVVSGLTDPTWDLATPAEPWTIRDQVSHLAFFDEQARTAAVDPEGFVRSLSEVADADDFVNRPLEHGRALAPADVLDWWRTARGEMLDAFASLDGSERIPWFGPPMGAASFVTARLMETWAHGQDVVDALGAARPPTARLRHVAHIGVRARPFSYSAHGLDPPAEPVEVALAAPDGDTWTWNEGAAQRVTGPALDFCLVVTQRRHVEDTDLETDGSVAREWMTIAQAFAGPPGSGRRPGQFARGGTSA